MNDLISRQAAIDAVNTALFPKINTAKDAEKALMALPSAEPKKRTQERTETHACDYISRQAAIDEIKALYEWHEIVTEDRAIDHFKRLPSADTDLSDYSDRLWKNAYERGKAEGARIPSAEPEIVRCKECKWSYDDVSGRICSHGVCVDCVVSDDFYCADAERRTDG